MTYPQYCGAWGGPNPTPTSPPAQACDEGSVLGLASLDSSLRPIRRPYFRYAAMKRSDPPTGGVALDIPGRCLNWDGNFTNRSMDVFTHELGHSVGLEHGGHVSWGGAHCKPHYTSLMNYSGEWPEFSLGTRLEVLNPSQLSEDGAYAPYVGQNPVSYLQRVPPTGNGGEHLFGYRATSASVDWDFFGGYSSFPVRANPTQPVNNFDSCYETHDAKARALDAVHSAGHRDTRLHPDEIRPLDLRCARRVPWSTYCTTHSRPATPVRVRDTRVRSHDQVTPSLDLHPSRSSRLASASALERTTPRTPTNGPIAVESI